MLTSNSYGNPQKVPIPSRDGARNRRSRPAAHAITRLSRGGGGNGRLSGKTTSQSTIRKEAIVGLKLTIRFCLLGSCAFWLLASACGTSSKTSRRNSSLTNKKAPAAKAAVAGSSSDSKNEAKAQSSDSAKASKKATAVETKKKPPGPPPPPPEPDLPTRFPHGLLCPIPSEVPAGTELIIRCAAKPVLATKSVVLQYRPSGTDRFVTTDANHSPKGWYVAKIPATEVKGSSLQFFAQAYNANNKVTASNGNDESPNILLIRKGGSGEAGAGGTDQPVADDDPLARIHGELAAANAEKNEGRRRAVRSWWLGLGMGTGWGWFPARDPENYGSQGARLPSSWSFGGVLHLLPEIGYQWTDHIMFSLQGRYQFVHTEAGAGCLPPACRDPNTYAWAVLGRAYLLSDGLFGRASNLQAFGTGTLGGGTAFRLFVAPSDNFKSSDTVNGGPLVAGLGGGLVYNFTNYLALAAEFRALFGFWDVAVVLEGGLSAQLKIWTPGARRAPPPETELPPETEPDYPPIE